MVSNPKSKSQASPRAASPATRHTPPRELHLWPLTSSDADQCRNARPAPNAYPAKPQTLCDTEPNRRNCPGMVAEPLN